MTRRVEIVEVGPRDGLQNEATTLSVQERLEFIGRLEAAGARRIEAASFVDSRRVPQMAGAEEIMAGLPPQPGRTRIGLVLNMRGWERCVIARCDEANVVVCATDGFGRANQGAGVDAQMAAACAIVARARTEGPPVSVVISVAFGCPFEGEVAQDRVVGLARDLHTAGFGEIALADTLGAADPWTVRRRVEAVRAATPGARLRLHLHDTRRSALANAYAGLEAGAQVLDASCGGIGGCPFAPGATGNLATEDLVWMLERAGYETGYNLDALIETGRWVSDRLGRPVQSALGRAGPFPPRG